MLLPRAVRFASEGLTSIAIIGSMKIVTRIATGRIKTGQDLGERYSLLQTVIKSAPTGPRGFAAKPIHRLRHDHIKLALSGIPEEPIKLGPLIPRLSATDAAVLVDADACPYAAVPYRERDDFGYSQGRFTREFKLEAVRLIRDRGVSSQALTDLPSARVRTRWRVRRSA